MCISPHKTDFKTYGPSVMTIKDLSSPNRVAGEGVIQWQLQDINGHMVIIRVFGYHIPAAKVRLLSPQVIISENGGHKMMTEHGIDIKLGNGIEILGRYCQRSSLPLILLAQNKWWIIFFFWNEAFGFSVNDLHEMKNILGKENTKLSISQKELLLWHQRCSHASIGWVQTSMRKKQWFESEGDNLLHSGPFIVAKNNAPTCNVLRLKCAACLCLKATLKLQTALLRAHHKRNSIL